MIIAIDGPAGSGKSSTAKVVAQKLGFMHLDTGAMYRVVTLKALREGIATTDLQGLEKCVKTTTIAFEGVMPNTKVLMDGEDVSDAIRSSDVTAKVAEYCSAKEVRDELVEQQRKLASSTNTVCEGRDMGTIVFPKADYKFFMVADSRARAERRLKDYEKLGVAKTVDELVAEIEERDRKDSTRDLAPLKQADDAVLLDTTNLTFDEQVQRIIDTIQ